MVVFTHTFLVRRLGDARYLSQQLPAAKVLYRQALQLRQLCCGPLTGGQAGPQEQLELAASFIKLGDVCKVGLCTAAGRVSAQDVLILQMLLCFMTLMMVLLQVAAGMKFLVGSCPACGCSQPRSWF